MLCGVPADTTPRAPEGDGVNYPLGGATFSADRRYRYRLWRHWSCGPVLLVIGLNPSTADETRNDATIRRCIGYAKR